MSFSALKTGTEVFNMLSTHWCRCEVEVYVWQIKKSNFLLSRL